MSTREVRQNWMQLASVQIGGAICLPVFVIGHTLAKTYGTFSAIIGLFFGNLTLLLIGSVVAMSSTSIRKSTAEFAVDLFGDQGKYFFSAAMVLSMMGWFAIQLNVMTLSFQEVIESDFVILENLFLGFLITLAGIRGIKGLTTLANMSIPILIFTIAYALYDVNETPLAAVGENELLTFSGISLVIACGIGAVVDLPTFFRLAKSKKDSLIAAIILFGLILPLIEGIGVYLFAHSQGDNIISLLASPASPKLWKLWVILFLLLAGWTTNNANLYSASVSLKTMMPKVSELKRTVLLGCVGTILSCFNFLDNLVLVLDMIGIVLVSMGAIMILHFLGKEKSNKKINFTAWVLGITGGALSQLGYSMTEIPVLDAFIVSLLAASYGIFTSNVDNNIVIRRIENEENISY
jgi:cytosine permease